MFVVMDLLDGGMLHDRIRSLDHYSERSASELIGNVLSGLAHIHAKGVIHRDLKAENLLLRKRSDKRDDPWLTDVCISDFGLATTGPAFSCCGTAPYIAPEVIELGYFHRSREPYDAKCDVWSLGVITYILLSGKWPFSGSCHDAIFKRIVKGKWRFSGDIWNKISAEARDFVRKCLTRDPNKRPSSRELLQHRWITEAQRDCHLGSSLGALRSCKALSKVHSPPAAPRSTCGPLPSLCNSVNNSARSWSSFTKYLSHSDRLSMLVEVRSQSNHEVVHHVDFGKALSTGEGWRLQDCCTCGSTLLCRHIQQVHEYLFVGSSRAKLRPFVYHLRVMQTEAERTMRRSHNDRESAAEVFYTIENIIGAAIAFSAAFKAVPAERRRGRAWGSKASRRACEETKSLLMCNKDPKLWFAGDPTTAARCPATPSP
ncbi:unnamed protein product [Trypanosoma congolense IL3000]|uniref:WGS project CAEQ00000000 data, annotated contig 2288 n=1 Tax=Trypanosoma congolense (strain IL3000) TaxID=1068625 RepID=F9WCY0_TRYCI|nr:unnamed protein product [Trypanosoma congolense IL3000]